MVINIATQVLPKVIWEEHVALAQLCNQVLLLSIGCPNSPQNCPFPFDDKHPIYYTHPSTDPTHHPKRHRDAISRCATIYFPDQQTDRHTDRPSDGIDDSSTPLALMLYWYAVLPILFSVLVWYCNTFLLAASLSINRAWAGVGTDLSHSQSVGRSVCLSGLCTVAKRLIGSGYCLGCWVGSVEG